MIETSNAYARGLLRGIASFVREHGWSIYLSEHGRGAEAPPWLRSWDGDGIIARIETEAIAHAVVDSGLPAVDVSAARHVPELPWVETDDAEIARLAAEHLLDRGFRHLGFSGLSRYEWSNRRREAFCKFVRERGGECHVHTAGRRREVGESEWASEQAELIEWVKGLPKPVGIMACYDIRGQQILDACRRVGIAVPDEVAIIGVDNDSVICDLADPPLSSIMPDTHATGYMAAELLARMMGGERLPPDGHLIRPLTVVARRSTDSFAIEDKDLGVALRYIRDHACEGISVEDVLEQVSLSRRVLESRLLKAIGCTPHDAIARAQQNKVKELLLTTDLPLKTIARRTGFRHAEYMSVAFKRAFGAAPGAFRREHGSRAEQIA